MVSPFLIDIWHEISSISSLCNVVTGQLDQVSEIRVVLMVIKLLLKLVTQDLAQGTRVRVITRVRHIG